MLNGNAFFGVDPARLVNLRKARAYRKHRQWVLRVASEPLISAYADRLLLSDRNTGTTSPFAHPRGRDTFLPIHRNGRRRVVELAIEGGVPDMTKYVIRAEEIGGGEPDVIILQRR